jgi:hypothetical protein
MERFDPNILFIVLAFLLASFSSGVAEEAICKADFPNGTWMRSQEEDKDPNSEWLLYRPSSYNFPASRGRNGFICLNDGRFGLIQPSPTDGRDTTWGTWKKDSRNRLKIKFENGLLNSLEWKKVEKGLFQVRIL